MAAFCQSTNGGDHIRPGTVTRVLKDLDDPHHHGFFLACYERAGLEPAEDHVRRSVKAHEAAIRVAAAPPRADEKAARPRGRAPRG